MAILVIVLFAAETVIASQVLFSASIQGQYNLSAPDGNNLVSTTLTNFSPSNFAFDETAQHLYVANRSPGQIERMNPDGTGRTVIVASRDNPLDIKIDVSGGKIYWREDGPGSYPTPDSFIRRANLDGTGVETIISGMPNGTSGGFDLDLAGGKIYYTAALAGIGISRADLDGSNQQQLYGNGLGDVAIDATNGDLYASSSGGILYKGKMDGSGSLSSFFNTGDGVSKLMSDPVNSLLYYTLPNSFPGSVNRIAFDGTGNTLLYNTSTQASAVTLGNVVVPEPTAIAIATICSLGLISPRRKRRQG